MGDLGPHGDFLVGETYLNLTNAFTDTNANGTWSLYIKDYYEDPPDGSSLQSAQLLLTTPPI